MKNELPMGTFTHNKGIHLYMYIVSDSEPCGVFAIRLSETVPMSKVLKSLDTPFVSLYKLSHLTHEGLEKMLNIVSTQYHSEMLRAGTYGHKTPKGLVPKTGVCIGVRYSDSTTGTTGSGRMIQVQGVDKVDNVRLKIRDAIDDLCDSIVEDATDWNYRLARENKITKPSKRAKKTTE